ncbi:alpha/beta fold hydrolase [Flavobacterium haoranii]|uniref:Homoserine O-acetyltransferase n=1 Tax=Flavobacterium haoranii TaxID=683124 RepID=A0A1M6DG54_9FLAO|nr:alpha/beta fold hydrolase [Flavobacterium haoranii]SHI72160.1 homoserine O-acetyltransferase [Flavobacterium haoranii]
MSYIQKIVFEDFQLQNGVLQSKVILSYQLFGQSIGTAPLVLVNHALTGNSQVIGENGWWESLIGEQKTINTNKYTVLVFNIPGNGYQDENNLIENYQDFTTYDIANLFWKGIDSFKVNQVFAVIGGSLGGAIAWEMAAIRPKAIANLIPVATNWKASDWLIGNVLIQDLILNNSKNPIHDARIHAMLLYRTPESLQDKFNTKLQSAEGLFQVESWLLHHGEKLQNRFQLSAYKLMNHLLKTTDIFRNRNQSEVIKNITSNIHLVSVDNDYFFTANEIKTAFQEIKNYKNNAFYHEIKSIHGHDAFLIEFEQLNNILKPIFN